MNQDSATAATLRSKIGRKAKLPAFPIASAAPACGWCCCRSIYRPAMGAADPSASGGLLQPQWMKPGDVVEVEIDGGIGILRNPIIAES